MLKSPPIIRPKPVPLLVIHAREVKKVVSISRFSSENMMLEKTKTRKYSRIYTVTLEAVAELTGRLSSITGRTARG